MLWLHSMLERWSPLGVNFRRFLNQKGGILIEFAFCVPVLIMMLYFCLDVPQVYQFISKMRGCSEMAAGLITNVHSDKNGPRLVMEELKYVIRALEIYLLGNAKVQGQNFNLAIYITCVTGTTGGGLKKNWVIGVNNDLSSHSITVYPQSRQNVTTLSAAGFSQAQSRTISSNLNNTEFANFQVDENSTKLIVEAFVWRNSNNKGFNKQFFMLSLPISLIGNKIVVISPPPGLISPDSMPPMTIEEALKEEK